MIGQLTQNMVGSGMIHVRDPDELASLMQRNCPPELLCDFDAPSWLACRGNFALREGDDLGLGEAGEDWPGPLTVHLFCVSRGKRAVEIGRKMLDQCFAYGATSIRAEIQTDRRYAVMFARRFGFKPVEEIERPNLGRFVVFERIDN